MTVIFYVTVCRECRRAFVSTARYENVPSHQHPASGWGCSGSGARPTTQAFRLDLDRPAVVEVHEESSR